MPPPSAPSAGRRLTLLGVAALLASPAPRPVAAPLPATLELAEMTWPDLRAALEGGARTVILPSGGVEQNGPHMVLSKHDHIIRHAALAIARALGGTLVAPVLSYVPQGRWDPPEANLRFPGTLGITPDAFEAVLEGAARSLRLAGFRLICLLADHGGSQAPQAAVAARLDAAWRTDGVRVLHVRSWYEAIAAQDGALRAEGVPQAALGTHAGLGDTAELMAVHPRGVMLDRLAGLRGAALEALGASGDPSRASAARGQALLALRIAAAVAEIRAARGD